MDNGYGPRHHPRLYMQGDFSEELQARLRDVDARGLRRRLPQVDSAQGPHLMAAGRSLLNFSSNDYLGLATHPALKEAAIRAIEKFGAGAGAARLISGSQAPHHELEEALAQFKGTEAALTFSSGYATALGVLGALLGKDDIVILDKLAHASLVDAVRLCGAKLRVFHHNDLADLEAKLKWADTRAAACAPRPRVVIITESVFSMDGDIAPLLNIADLKDRYGAWLMVDEAHATGLYGEMRRGVLEEFGVGARVEIQMGTLGKALGAAGGYICGTRALVDLVMNRARSFIFSTAPVPAQVAAARAGVAVVQSPEGAQRRDRLWALVDHLKNGLIRSGWKLPAVRSAILPVRVGAELAAMKLAERLLAREVWVPAVRYPTVARGAARLRITVSAAHETADLDCLIAAMTHARDAHE